jgi:hypothetical protein
MIELLVCWYFSTRRSVTYRCCGLVYNLSVIKSRGRDGQGMRHGYKVLVGECEGKRPLGSSGHRWEGNIKMDLKGWVGLDWFHLG